MIKGLPVGKPFIVGTPQERSPYDQNNVVIQ